jgi:hypothetical protein
MWGINERGDGDGRFGRYKVPDGLGGGTARLNNPWTPTLGKTCPGPGKIAEFPALLAAVQARVGGAPAPQPVPAPTPAPQPAPAPTPVAGGHGTTTVQPGEGWVQVAERVFGDHRRAAEIRDLNGGPTRTLHPGDVLQLP